MKVAICITLHTESTNSHCNKIIFMDFSGERIDLAGRMFLCVLDAIQPSLTRHNNSLIGCLHLLQHVPPGVHAPCGGYSHSSNKSENWLQAGLVTTSAARPHVT